METRGYLFKYVPIRFFAVMVVLCYTLGPFQYELASLAHSLSHQMRMPAMVLSHEAPSTEAHYFLGEDISTSVQHTHDLLEELGKLSESESPGGAEQVPLENKLKIQLDQPGVVLSLTRNRVLVPSEKKCFRYGVPALLKGHGPVNFRPPQS